MRGLWFQPVVALTRGGLPQVWAPLLLTPCRAQTLLSLGFPGPGLCREEARVSFLCHGQMSLRCVLSQLCPELLEDPVWSLTPCPVRG